MIGEIFSSLKHSKTVSYIFALSKYPLDSSIRVMLNSSLSRLVILSLLGSITSIRFFGGVTDRIIKSGKQIEASALKKHE